MDNHAICELISLSVGAVMRQSLNDNFKEQCKNIIGAADTRTVEKLLYQKLKLLTEEKASGFEHVSLDTSRPELAESPKHLLKDDDNGNKVLAQVELTNTGQPQVHPVPSSQPGISDDESDLIWD